MPLNHLILSVELYQTDDENKIPPPVRNFMLFVKKSGQPTFDDCPDNFFPLSLIVEDIFQSLDVHVAIELREVSRELD